MKIIALTGGIACGKTTLANMLRELGAPVIDADAISRSLTAPGGKALPALRETFGSSVFQDDHTLNRAALAAKVFQNPEQLRKLNAVTHPLIIERMQSEIERCRKSGAPVVVLDVPLLFETGLDRLADETVCVSAPLPVQAEAAHDPERPDGGAGHAPHPKPDALVRKGKASRPNHLHRLSAGGASRPDGPPLPAMAGRSSSIKESL